MLPEISDEMIVESIQSLKMVDAGRTYFEEGRVEVLKFDETLEMVAGVVRGSGKNLYFSSLLFIDEGERISCETDCTCPVGFGCKHAAALLFACKDAAQGLTGRGLRITASPERELPHSGPVAEWVNALSFHKIEQSLPVQPMRFVMEPQAALKAQGQRKPPRGVHEAAPERPWRFTLRVRAYRWEPAGRWVQVQPYEYSTQRLGLDPIGLRLLQRMNSHQGGDFSHNGAPEGPFGWRWLSEASAAGLLTWGAPDGPAVSLAKDHHQADLDWIDVGGGKFAVGLKALGEDLIVLAGDPPLVANVKTAQIAIIDAGKDVKLTGLLLGMPPIGPDLIPSILGKWTEWVGDALPPPRIEGLQDLGRLRPQPVLKLMRDRGEEITQPWRRRYRKEVKPIDLARLEFDYGGRRVRALATSAEVFEPEGAGYVRFERDIEAEQAAADRLSVLGLSPLIILEDLNLKPAQGWDHCVKGARRQSDYVDFMINDLDRLREEGWLIEYGPGWRLEYSAPDAGPAEFSLKSSDAKSPGAIDWFDLELEALVGGRRIDILPAIRRLLSEKQGGVLEFADDRRLPLFLDDGRITSITLGAVRPLLEAMIALAMADPKGGRLRVSRFDAGLIYQLAKSGQPWASETALKQLALDLGDPSGENWTKPVGLVAELRPYQRAGASWLLALHRASMGGILADEMGLGKTLQAISHILQVKAAPGAAKPTLVVAPTSVLPNWRAEFEKFAPDLEFLVWHGADRKAQSDKLAAAAVILTSYPLLARDKAVFLGLQFDLVVLDEAHVLKNPATAGFKAAIELKSGQVLALTGTPIENRLTDLWSLASLTNANLLGSFDSFTKTWRTPIEKHGDPVAKAALRRRLRPFSLRRTKDEVATELPPKSIIPEHIELSEAQARLYESQRLLMNVRIREEIERVGLSRSQIVVLDAMLKLRQICCDPLLLRSGLGEGAGSAKRERLMEMLPELIEDGRRVIVFSQFTKMLDLISLDLFSAGIAHEQLRGSTVDRARPVARFQKGEVPLILVSLKAGGTGVNLTAADTVILYDPWWNPAVEAQAIDRAHRIGQTKPVFVHRLIASSTIEEKILTLQAKKQELADMLWSSDGASSSFGLNEEDIAFLLG